VRTEPLEIFSNSPSSLSKKLSSVSGPISGFLGLVSMADFFGKKFLSYLYVWSFKKYEHDKELSILTRSEITWVFTLHKLYSEVFLVNEVSFLLFQVTQKKKKINMQTSSTSQAMTPKSDGPRNINNNFLYPWLPTLIFKLGSHTNIRGAMHYVCSMKLSVEKV
jgi:hypothetical protein